MKTEKPKKKKTFAEYCEPFKGELSTMLESRLYDKWKKENKENGKK